MGSLKNLPLNKIIEKYKCSILFETGTGNGSSIEYARNFSFKSIISCEINSDLYSGVKSIFANDYCSSKLSLFNADSETTLKEILPQLSEQEPVLFWLDAHYPGADFGFFNFDEELRENIRLPLETELQLIRNIRLKAADVIIIDDLRIYEDGPYLNGPAPDVDRLPRFNRSLDIVNTLFSQTHKLIRSYKDEGYLFIVPINEESDNCPIAELALPMLVDENLNIRREGLRLLHLGFNSSLNIHALLYEKTVAFLLKNILSPMLSDELSPWRNVLSQLKSKEELTIVGCGLYSAMITALCNSLNIKIRDYVTDNEVFIGKYINDTPVLSIKSISQKASGGVLIASIGSQYQIYNELIEEVIVGEYEIPIYFLSKNV